MKTSLAGARRRALGALMCAAALLAACGGGEPIERFVAKRLIVLGDETSVLNSDGSKYSVSGFDIKDNPDCAVNPLWVQILANLYGLRFAQCAGSSAAPFTALMFAAPGATVSDISAQITAVGGFVDKDLVTLLAGANDILAQYALISAGTQVEGACNQTHDCSGASEVLKGAALALGGQVNRIRDAGGRVLISTVPDLGLTPFAIAEDLATPGRAALLSRLSQVFNDFLRNGFVNDGRRIGLLLTDEMVLGVVRNPAAAGLINWTEAVCQPGFAPPTCTTKTLVAAPPGSAASASASNYLWASDRLLSSSGQGFLGSLAINRATGNPF